MTSPASGRERIQRLVFPSAAPDYLQLEGILHRPDRAYGRWPGAVVCHPYPPAGGSMHTIVVSSLARELARRGIVALRFNFRGVGASQGTFDNGLGEMNDVQAAVDTLESQETVDGTRLAIVGYSFGAWVGLQHAVRDARIQALVAVGLPLWRLPRSQQARAKQTMLFVAGERDHLCPPQELRNFVAESGFTGSVRVIHETDHYLAGHEDEVGRVAASFVADHFQQPPPA